MYLQKKLSGMKSYVEVKKCDEYDKQVYQNLAEGKINEVKLSSALLDLSSMIRKHYGITYYYY